MNVDTLTLPVLQPELDVLSRLGILTPYDEATIHYIDQLLTLLHNQPGIGHAHTPHYEWDRMDPRTVRAIVLYKKLYNIPHAIPLCEALLVRNIFYFEDFEEMSPDWGNCDFHFTTQTMQKIYEVGRFVGNLPKARDMAHQIANSGTLSWRAMKHMGYAE